MGRKQLRRRPRRGREAAEEEIARRLGNDVGGERDACFDLGDLVARWDIDGATDGHEVEEHNITMATTDERLEEIAAEILSGMAEISPSGVVVCDGLEQHLRGLRDELADKDRSVYWSVMRGEAPGAHAVQPGPLDVTCRLRC